MRVDCVWGTPVRGPLHMRACLCALRMVFLDKVLRVTNPSIVISIVCAAESWERNPCGGQPGVQALHLPAELCHLRSTESQRHAAAVRAAAQVSYPQLCTSVYCRTCSCSGEFPAVVYICSQQYVQLLGELPAVVDSCSQQYVQLLR